ncbi:MAG TPA: aminotransferase class I/II-fold pyridoxal phosphate-dependent enzyme [Thermomicrobiales bacterium]|jgi:methionine-gamma-lyase|nr:methionine gamma-lyase [Chloroflexota bacterium]HQX63032.1 aminotransferase class I/II-fold pyridoxal phosphate-dependent enzyme [Thermomicrobiales bacterium]HBY46454.1 methionine gamma-lyase [Chloroflexota bacterium]HCG28172.1 methionine gamma-lyase [Chloroflexota bacterium]HQZ88644.1 aminotransferase class I/II-fold pyridoxal phosphate-dependent enzyme [Thermomicrobiales bacterium]
MADLSDRQGFSTRAIHAGEHHDSATGAHNTPIYQTATYVFDSLDQKAEIMAGEREGYVYTRGGNPTTAAFEHKMAILEGAEAAVAAASGMGVIAGAFNAFARAGDHIVASDDVYHWAEIFLSEEAPAFGVEVTRVDITDLDAVRAAMRPNTRILYTEFLANPTIRIADVPALGQIARDGGALLIVDNTFTSPYLFRPLEHGAHLSLHSATKYISGHGDALAGVIAGTKELVEPINRQVQVLGSPISPFNSWLLLRGVKTLELRMERHCQNAMEVARFLERQPEVELVNYAGLESHPGHELAKRLTGGRYGGMLSFRMRGGIEQGNRFADKLQLCAHAVSLGDVFTLVWPHRDDLVRVSVGCENVDDIIADFEQALEATASPAGDDASPRARLMRK